MATQCFIFLIVINAGYLFGLERLAGQCRLPKLELNETQDAAIKQALNPWTLDCLKGLEINIPFIVQKNAMDIELNQHEIDKLGITDLKCCFNPLYQGWKDFEATPCQQYNPDNMPSEVVGSYCKTSDGSFEQKNVHYIFRPSGKIRPADDDALAFSVLVIGLESLSRQRFHEYLPRTAELLIKEMNGIDMETFHSVDSDRYNNLVGLLTGRNQQQFDKCSDEDCQPIWNHFNDHGYVTAFGEDINEASILNHRLKPIADYDMRRFGEILRRQTGHKTIEGRTMCAGPEWRVKRMLQNIAFFVKEFESQPSFGFFWSGTITHASAALPNNLDELFSSFFRNLSPLLKNTILILVSDVGTNKLNLDDYRFQVERTSPVAIIILPSTLEQNAPDLARNLASNKNKLATSFDIYATFLHLLDETPAHKLPGQSLLVPMKPDRECSDASIPEHLCHCLTLKRVDNHPGLGSEIAKAAIHSIIEKNFPHHQAESEGNIMKLQKVIDMHELSSIHRLNLYVVRFQVVPSLDTYETEVEVRDDLTINVKKLRVIAKEKGVRKFDGLNNRRVWFQAGDGRSVGVGGDLSARRMLSTVEARRQIAENQRAANRQFKRNFGNFYE